MGRDIRAAAAVSVAAVLGASLVLSACVEVPDTIRAHFAAASPEERSNYRPGRHGSALPFEDAEHAQPASPSPRLSGAHDGAHDAMTRDGGGASVVGDSDASVTADAGGGMS